MKKNIFLNSKGYTLVEMLAVIIVFSIIGGIIAAIFASSLRGSNKVNITNEIRQNGNYALLQMSKMITYAKSFDGISVTSNEDDYKVDCYSETTELTISPTTYHYLRISDFNGGQITFECMPLSITSNSASLVDENIVTVNSCNFSCHQSSISDPPTIGISFNLSQKNESTFAEHKASISFETTATMRNTGY